MRLYNKKLLFAISSLGLGHATRTLALIHHLKENNEITIISYGNALNFLKKELDGCAIHFISMVDYPNLERGRGIRFYYYLVLDLIQTSRIIKQERKQTKAIEKEYDFIISDGRYGICSTQIPSFLISHQISFVPPAGLSLFSFVSDLGNYLSFRTFDRLLIPDFQDFDHSLAGKLSHTKMLQYLHHDYIGLLSSYHDEKICDENREAIDYLFVISGYLQEHKEHFVTVLMEQAKKLTGVKIFVLGDASHDEISYMPEYNITIYPSVSSEIRKELFARAKVIISRTGYTTVMDLAELGKKAILFPTPNQTEQEYLAEFHQGKMHFVIGEEHHGFDLSRFVSQLPQTTPVPVRTKTKEALAYVENMMQSYLETHFFSIIIPAYNEEKYIIHTLENLSRMEYENFEVIVVENGSDDCTYKVANTYKEEMSNLKVLQSHKGVSKAKNLGLSKVDERSDWVVFLDADTILKPGFLHNLNHYLNKHKDDNLSVGTCEISAYDSTRLYTKWWLKFYDLGHRLSKTSYSLQIAKTDIAQSIKFDEALNYSEDLKFIRQMQVFGRFFFLETKNVQTSVRRFEKDGYFRTLMYWNIQALTPEFLKKNKNYRSIR
ncbi:glycosyltransferase [Sulfurospirillum sp. 1612]|uniref:glycosyltransferase n=1 Tax=Sulfurospirillum sp. 1612 TaxID=3094835 RepID=UPI002F95E4AE